MPVPILLVTGYAKQFDAADTSFAVLRKPAQPRDFKATVAAGGLTAPNVI